MELRDAQAVLLELLTRQINEHKATLNADQVRYGLRSQRLGLHLRHHDST